MQRPAAAIRVLVVDDHPALRDGLRGLVGGERDMDCVGTVAEMDGLLTEVRARRPDVVVLDYALGDTDGLSACFHLKQEPDPPAVILYSASPDVVFAVPAAIAQADETVPKNAPVWALLRAIRRGAAGESARAGLDPEVVEAASARLAIEDLPVARMLLGGTPVADIAQALGLPRAEIRRRALRIIGRLQQGG